MIKKKGIINFSIVLGLYAILLFSSTASAAQECIDCHDTYVSAWNSSKHNNSGAGAPDCTGCHTGYDVQHTGKIVNESCLLYTSDAADDLLCVDLGGRR